jgi:CheY-like chemotaxis protein
VTAAKQTDLSEQRRLKLLLVDDEPDVLSTLAEILEEEGYAVVSTWEGEEAVEIATLFKPHVLITDFRLPGMDGVKTIHAVREQAPRVRSILVSGHVSWQTRERAVNEQVERIFEKPLAIPELLRTLSNGRVVR